MRESPYVGGSLWHQILIFGAILQKALASPRALGSHHHYHGNRIQRDRPTQHPGQVRKETQVLKKVLGSMLERLLPVQAGQWVLWPQPGEYPAHPLSLLLRDLARFAHCVRLCTNNTGRFQTLLIPGDPSQSCLGNS